MKKISLTYNSRFAKEDFWFWISTVIFSILSLITTSISPLGKTFAEYSIISEKINQNTDLFILSKTDFSSVSSFISFPDYSTYSNQLLKNYSNKELVSYVAKKEGNGVSSFYFNINSSDIKAFDCVLETVDLSQFSDILFVPEKNTISNQNEIVIPYDLASYLLTHSFIQNVETNSDIENIIGKNILIPFYYKRYSQTIYKNFIVANVIKNDAYNNPFFLSISKHLGVNSFAFMSPGSGMDSRQEIVLSIPNPRSYSVYDIVDNLNQIENNYSEYKENSNAYFAIKISSYHGGNFDDMKNENSKLLSLGKFFSSKNILLNVIFAISLIVSALAVIISCLLFSKKNIARIVVPYCVVLFVFSFVFLFVKTINFFSYSVPINVPFWVILNLLMAIILIITNFLRRKNV